MPKYNLVITQYSVVCVEAPSAEALDKTLDGEALTDILDYLDGDPDNWELATDIREGLPDVPAELRLAEKNGELVLLRIPQEGE